MLSGETTLSVKEGGKFFLYKSVLLVMSLPKIPEMLLEECKDFVSKSFVKDPKEVWTTEMLLNHSFVAVDLEDNHREDFVVKVKEDEKVFMSKVSF
ncbi:unnamed protein product [Arabidopsis thaliana]|uniref:Uncharacterized protein n=1 Tax=Arabidopsis thaliana TaxID=3702 RepID=A0A5S9XHZ7_ARATH|nr:unnamed protein product [Arabidopsis thaliana]